MERAEYLMADLQRLESTIRRAVEYIDGARPPDEHFPLAVIAHVRALLTGLAKEQK